MMSLVSTRTAATASPFEAVLCGLAPDGGLYVPASLPTWTLSQIQDLVGLPYEKAAALILHGFFDEISQEKMEALCAEAYASFSDERRVPVSSIEPGLFAMELYHGPTLAFKDVALQLLPLLMAYSAKAVSYTHLDVYKRQVLWYAAYWWSGHGHRPTMHAADRAKQHP